MGHAKQKKVLLWLEDEVKTVKEQLDFATTRFHVERVSQLQTFVKSLNKPDYHIKGIILDVMLHGVKDLSPLQEGVNTKDGFETGWRVLEYLRSNDSQFKHIPVLVLSVRDLTEENKAQLERLKSQTDATPVEFIGKRETTNLGDKDWNQRFQEWIKDLERGKQND
ncbi:MAG: hypothetical protein BWK78_08550 [Thiotrichaceae bacterium IS1]|nr:MAG: hypothetical protein BWK78_08550 [Thiotrichaceae bacterium IS1]